MIASSIAAPRIRSQAKTSGENSRIPNFEIR
jgi:hypothetical protein